MLRCFFSKKTIQQGAKAMGNVIYVDFSKRQDSEMWELHLPISITWDHETDYGMAIRCPDEKYQELIARKIKKLDGEKVPYKVFLDGELVHHEIHLQPKGL